MAYKMDVSADMAADGAVREGAYWVPVMKNAASIEKTGLIIFYAYATPQAMDAGKSPISGAIKEYKFSRAQFLEAMSLPLSKLFPVGTKVEDIRYYDVEARFCYYIAKQRLDVPMLKADGTPQLDAEGAPVMRSFFEEAVNA